jgi:hypothetical protein
MKKPVTILALFVAVAIIACATNPYTGKSTMALVNNDSLLESSFSEYKQFLSQSAVVTSGTDAAMVQRVGNRIKLVPCNIERFTKYNYRDGDDGEKGINSPR